MPRSTTPSTNPSKQPTIRCMATNEGPVCATIYTNAWNVALPHAPRQISPEDFAKETQGEQIFVATTGAGVVGFLSLWVADSFIHHLYVAPHAHSLGIGTALLAHAERLVGPASLCLKCQRANTRALAFYGARGFRETTDTGRDEFGHWVRLLKR